MRWQSGNRQLSTLEIGEVPSPQGFFPCPHGMEAFFSGGDTNHVTTTAAAEGVRALSLFAACESAWLLPAPSWGSHWVLLL